MKKIITITVSLLILPIINLECFAQTNLSDISGNKNEIAIQFLFQNNVISGYSDGTFRPNNVVTRAELSKIVATGQNIFPDSITYNSCFTDVKNEWFAPYVCYAKEQNWVNGYSNGQFKPNQVVNKFEALKILLNSQGISTNTTSLEKPFSDVETGTWYEPFISKAKELGILEESGNIFSGSKGMTRAGISENLYRIMIIRQNGLNNFTEYNSETHSNSLTNQEEEKELVPVTSMSVHWYEKNWDSDADNDGYELGVYFKDDDDNLVYPNVNDWTINIKIYKAEMDYDKYGDFAVHKTSKTLHSLTFTGTEVKYEKYLNLPYVRIPYESISKLTDGYGYIWTEATLSSEKQGTFSASMTSIL